MNSKILGFQSYLIFSLPVLLLTGSFLPDLSIVLCGIFFIILSIKNKEWHYYLHPLSIIFFTWCSYIVLRSLLSSYPTTSLESSLFYFRFGFFALSVWYIIDKNPNFIRIFTLVISLTFLVVVIDSYIQFFTGSNLLGFTLFYSEVYTGNIGAAHRLSGFFDDKLILGSYLSRLLPIIFAFITLQYSNSKIITVLSMLLLIATDLIVFISGERSAFLYLIIITTLIVLFVKKWRLLRVYTILISISIMTIVALNNKDVKNRMIDYTLEQLNIISLFSSTNENNIKLSTDSNKKSKLQSYIEGDLSFEESGIGNNRIIVFSWHHQRHYQSALKMFSDHPIFGVGPKLFKELCKEDKYFDEYSCSTHPHNTYIQLLSETGLVGFIPVFSGFLFVCFIFLRQLFIKSSNKMISSINDYQLCLYCAIFVTLWPLVPTGSIFNNWLGVIYFMPIGFLLSSYRKRSDINN